jgi:peptidoglycan/xylan/chitin deacetylase (PgdA/CDA1 family)
MSTQAAPEAERVEAAGQGPTVELAPWKNDAPFVFSMTYDEGTIDHIVNAYPIHEEYGIPGHVCQVAGYLGTQRLERGTAMREVFHMSGEHLRFLVARGWSVSSHSHSHPPTNQDGVDLDLEIRISKLELERALGSRVRLFGWWNNLSLAEKALPLVKEAGYDGALSLGHPFNGPDFDVWSIERNMLADDMDFWFSPQMQASYHQVREAGPGNLTRETSRGSWIADITHIVVDQFPAACPPSLWNRCARPSQLAARFREIRSVWGDEVWATVPEAVVDYAQVRRAARVSVETTAAHRAVCTVSLAELPRGVECRDLTLVVRAPWSALSVNEGRIPVRKRPDDGAFVFTAPVADSTRFVLEAA